MISIAFLFIKTKRYVPGNRYCFLYPVADVPDLRIGVHFFFLARGLQKIDEDVPGSSWGFRIIIIPGCILLWPVLLRKWIRIAKIK
ncbi:MAG: hypothetical protein ICV84_23160 [Flavisolibacter sp.]|nr:hypothetical protein [Flavisolibacter sp.]